MAARTFSSRSAVRKSHSSLLFFGVIIGLVLIVPMVFILSNAISTELRGRAASGQQEFLKAEGKDLVYRGIKTTLRGFNFDNIGALGANIGSNNINDMTINESDYERISALGANHARLGLSYTWYEQDRNKFFQKIDEQVAWAKKNGIWVTLLTFTNPDGNNGCYEGYSEVCDIWNNSTYQQQLQDFWVDVARHYSNEPAVVGYDLVNEPNPQGPNYCRTWFDIAQRMRNAVTDVAPNQLIFIESCDDPSFDRVFKEKDGVTKANNVVYETHDYDPMAITHPGYAPNPSNLKTYPGTHSSWVQGVQKNIYFDKSTFEGTRYPGEYSVAKHSGLEWANQNNVPFYIGEWGAQGWAHGYAQYIKDKAEVYNALGINHAYYTWKHDINTGWRWGVTNVDGSAVDQSKLDAVRVAIQSSIKPQFGDGPVVSPPPSIAPSPTPTPVVVPTPSPSPSPSPTPTIAPASPVASPRATIQPSIVPTTQPTSSPTAAPTQEPSPTPLPTVGTRPSPSMSAYIDIFDEWQDGYCAKVVVRNYTDREIKNWWLSFNMNQSQFVSKWNGTFINLLGKTIVISSRETNWLPAYGTNDTVDWCARKTGKNWTPSNLQVLSGVALRFRSR